MRLRAAARHAVKNICVGDKTLHPRRRKCFFFTCSIKLPVLFFDGVAAEAKIFLLRPFFIAAHCLYGLPHRFFVSPRKFSLRKIFYTFPNR